MDIRKHKNYTLKSRGELPSIIAEMADGDSIQDFREWVIHAEQQAPGKRRFYNLATAASITGYVRAMLWRSICAADRPIYCDTDSITARGFGPEVTLSKELGDWEIEYEYDRVIVCGKKLYAMHKKGEPENNASSWKMASKGARLDYKDLIKIAAGEVVDFHNIVPTFSMNKERPTFIDRKIKMTAADVRIVPRRYDPKYVE